MLFFGGVYLCLPSYIYSNILNGKWQWMADRVSKEIGGKAEGASHKALWLGQRDGGLPRLGKRMRGGDHWQIASSGFPLCFVTLIPDLTCILRFSGGRGLRKIDVVRVRNSREELCSESTAMANCSQNRGYFAIGCWRMSISWHPPHTRDRGCPFDVNLLQQG